MKKLLLSFAAIIALLTAITSCKPNESAYKAAYESALAKRDSTDGIEGTIYNRFRQQGRPSDLIVGNDTLPIVTEIIGYTENGGASRENTERYNIVVGRFKQVFNARQMRERIQAAGYPDAFILHTREPLYYVVAVSCSTARQTIDELRRVQSDPAMTLRAPLPFVLQPAHLAR